MPQKKGTPAHAGQVRDIPIPDRPEGGGGGGGEERLKELLADLASGTEERARRAQWELKRWALWEPAVRDAIRKFREAIEDVEARSRLQEILRAVEEAEAGAWAAE